MLLSATLESVGQLIVALVVFVIVLFACYLTTRWVGGYQKQATALNITQVIETVRLGNNKYAQLVKCGNKYFLIGLGKDEVTSLGELSEEDFPEGTFDKNTSTPTINGDFKAILERMKGNKRHDETS